MWYNITENSKIFSKIFFRETADKKTTEWGTKALQFSPLFSITFGLGLSGTGFLIAIAALACILGAEVAGICILISKMLRARKMKYDRDFEESERDRNSNYRNYAAVLLFGAVPQSTYITLTILAVLTAAAAVVFLALLIIFRARGYDFASSAWYREEQARRKRSAVAESAQAPELPSENSSTEYEAPVYADLTPAEDEEQRQDAYTDAEEQAAEDEEPLAAFEEELPIAEELSVPAEILPEAVAQTQPTVISGDAQPMAADGSRPYKVVEKVVTETFKEVYKETPPAAPQTNAATDAVMEKLADFLDYEMQKRKEQEAAEAEKDETKKDADGAAIATFASAENLYDDDDAEEDEADDEDELEDSEERKSEDDEDSDDEENDTDGDRFTGNERIIGFDEETGCYIVAHYRKSFEAKLIQSRPNIKKYYSELKNALLSYKGTKNRISWTADSFHNGRTPIAKINVKTRILELYLALDPASLDGTVYRGTDVSHIKKYADTPFRYKLRTPRKFKWAMELVQRVCEEHGLSPIDIEHVDYEQQYPFDTTENLVARNLIKEYIRQEKPATTFELAPDHVPAVPEEDESVIPANANFSWEFDNEMMVEKEPEPIPEVEPEPVAEPEPIVEPEPEVKGEPQPSVVRETVKVTEMRYTERYYADSAPTFEQTVTTTEPIEVDAISNDGLTADEPVAEESTETSFDAGDADNTATEGEEPETVDVWGDLTVEVEAESEEPVADEDASAYGDEAVEYEGASAEETEELFFEDEPNEEEETEEVEEIEAVETAEEVEEPVPFRPSFYATRNYYADETEEAGEEASEDTEEYEEADSEAEEAIEETAPTYATVSEPEPVAEPEPVRKRIINPGVAVVDICSIEDQFPQDSVIKLDSLKALGLVVSTANVLKIYASGPISKSFTVEANHFTLDAIKAISDADGDAVMIR